MPKGFYRVPDVQFDLQQMQEALAVLLADDGEQDPAVLATLLSFPGAAELEALQAEADPLALYLAGHALREQFGVRLAQPLQHRLQQLQQIGRAHV